MKESQCCRFLNYDIFFLGVHILSFQKDVLLPSSILMERPPLWSSGQSFWLLTQGSRVRLPALPDFLRNSGSGTGSTQPREQFEELPE
jgi:hypothetical protein